MGLSRSLHHAVLVLAVLFLVATPALAGVAGTKHDLSYDGPGPIKALSETRICVFCHIPHNANPAVPLWNHQLGAVTYSMYASSTIQGTLDGTVQPNGSSKLCLSCHDGAVAIGAVVSDYRTTSPLAMTGTDPDGTLPDASTSNLGLDLTDDHPTSLRPATGATADAELRLIPLDSRVKYDAAGFLQCTSCHNPHDDSYGKFLVKPNVDGGVGSRLCVDCHQKFDWENSAHRNAANLYNAKQIVEQGCAICHSVHKAAIPVRLLKAAEEDLCNTCHSGSSAVSPALPNVAAEFSKDYRHPVATRGLHDTAESIDAAHVESAFETKLQDPNQRHAECEDCHNPHAARAGTHAQGFSTAGTVLLGAWGMKPDYTGVAAMQDPVVWTPVQFTDPANPDMLEAYLCFKCHPDQAKYFNPANGSYHACVATPKTSGYGTYLSPWNATSRMTCSDCHTSDNLGLKGPHGSAYAANVYQQSPLLSNPVLLLADYQRGNGKSSGTGAAGTNNHLCFRCHDRNVYGDPTNPVQGGTGFYRSVSPNLHNNGSTRHSLTSCTSCHVVHGASRRALLAVSSDPWHLGSLLTSIAVVSPGAWTKGSCSTSCH